MDTFLNSCIIQRAQTSLPVLGCLSNFYFWNECTSSRSSISHWNHWLKFSPFFFFYSLWWLCVLLWSSLSSDLLLCRLLRPNSVCLVLFYLLGSTLKRLCLGKERSSSNYPIFFLILFPLRMSNLVSFFLVFWHQIPGRFHGTLNVTCVAPQHRPRV